MKTIVLTGMMGCGKSTTAKLLAQKLNIELADIDIIIEKKENKSISEIFEQCGEQYFRDLEKQTIKEIFIPENQVIALGGGAIENPQTREFLLNNSTVIYLDTSAENIFERIKHNTSRPLLSNNMSTEKINEIIKKRIKNYSSAHLIISTDNKTANEVADEITGVLKND